MQWNMTTNNYGGYKMSNIDELEKIQELKEKGILSEEEFETEKAKILNVNSNSEKNIKDEQKKESKILKNKKIKHCKKCGAEIEEGATFCGKCGTRIKGVKIRNTIIIGCSILVIIFFIYAIITFINPNINEKEMEEMLKGAESGTYLQENTVKIGKEIDFEYKEYNKLVSYSCTYMNGNTTLEAGGLIFVNKNNFKIIKLDLTYTSILHYLIEENQSSKLEQVMILLGNCIKDNNVEQISTNNMDLEKYMEVNREVGKVVGVQLGREILKTNNLNKAYQNLVNSTYLYGKDEITPRYIGTQTTEQEYVWTVIDEYTARILYTTNIRTYNQLVAMYGPPYENVQKFVVYDLTKEGAPKEGTYKDIEEAKKELNVEE